MSSASRNEREPFLNEYSRVERCIKNGKVIQFTLRRAVIWRILFNYFWSLMRGDTNEIDRACGGHNNLFHIITECPIDANFHQKSPLCIDEHPSWRVFLFVFRHQNADNVLDSASSRCCDMNLNRLLHITSQYGWITVLTLNKIRTGLVVRPVHADYQLCDW